MLTLNNLKSPGANRDRKRIGRGQGSGWGKQAGKGHKGQKARTGGGIAIGFEGGQMPMYRRLPKKGFSNYLFRKHFAEINLGTLQEYFKGNTVSRETLTAEGFLSGKNKNLPIKILAKGDFSKSLTFDGIEKFTKSAVTAIEKAGGKINHTEEQTK
ncbi:MAG: 50S ribosomal protein L15 [Halobacteriovoraceae bacterium]|nr:50S ribosomal protein L15 [Halobacteriovoraceae bacterium]